jgi:hypothetical protein
MEMVMSRNQNDESPPRPTDREQPLTRPNELVDVDPLNDPTHLPKQPADAEPEPGDRPDLDWAEHED